MASLETFLRTGELGPIRLGMSPSDAMSVLGEAQEQSRKQNPLELKYGSLQLTFWKHGPRSQLMVIGLYCQPSYKRIPPQVTVADITLSNRKSEKAFRSYLHDIGYLPVHMVVGESGTRLIMPSGVNVQFAEGKLHSITHSQQNRKENPEAPLSDEREPTFEQINEMLAEANHLAKMGSTRAGIVLAWAGLEAVLRRVALNAGFIGRIGVQPSILLRELFAARALSQDDTKFLEEMRQLRTSVAHGLKPTPISADYIVGLVNIAHRLLSKPPVTRPS